MFVSLVVMVRLLLTVQSLVLLLMAMSAWNRRRLAPEAPTFALLMMSAAIYCFGYSGELAQTTLGGALFWLHVEYLGVPWIPGLWLLGARKQCGMRTHYGLLFAIPLLAFLAQQTTPMHRLYDVSIKLAPHGPFMLVAIERGPIAWLGIAYLNVALLYGAWIYLFRSPGVERRPLQSAMMVASSLIPLGGYMTYLFGWSFWGLDLGSGLLGATAILGYLTVFRFGIFDLVPMARSLVFNNMRDAVIVADLRHRLVDFNPAARELLPCLEAAEPGSDLACALGEMPALAKVLLGPDGSHQLDLDCGGERQHFKVRVFPLFRDKRRSGSAAILANTTAQVRLMNELRHTADTDSLTGVANRRCFLAAIETECARSARYGEPFSVAVVDLDHFKSINDQMGHHAGDSVMFRVAGQVLRCMRESDLLSRYGGDEFAILLPRTNAEGAFEVAERIRKTVADSTMEVDGRQFRISASIGVATHEPGRDANWDQLLKHADKALYEAKAQGRNSVAAWEQASLPAVDKK